MSPNISSMYMKRSPYIASELNQQHMLYYPLKVLLLLLLLLLLF
jgi:hypothetical protein